MNSNELCTLANIAAHEMEKFLGITFTMQELDLYTKTYVEMYFAA